jgi:hypothetical protein
VKNGEEYYAVSFIFCNVSQTLFGNKIKACEVGSVCSMHWRGEKYRVVLEGPRKMK